MKPRNPTFAQVIRGKARSPQPLSKPSNISLAEMFDQWEQYPDEDYTLYLGQFNHSFKSRHSSIRLYASKNQQMEEEQMFDSWIQRQSTINANKENYLAQPSSQSRRVVQIQKSTQPSFSTKIKEAADQKSKKTVSFVRNDNIKRQTPKPVINFKNLQNIGGHIKMIKSNTCENQQMEKARSPQRHKQIQNINLDVSQRNYQQYGQEQQHEQQSNYNREEYEEEVQNQNYEGIKTVKSERNFSYKEQINNLVEQTNNHIQEQITELAHNYVEEKRQEESWYGEKEREYYKEEPQQNMIQSRQSEMTQSVQEEDDELLIGNSDRKPLGNYFKEDNFFSQEYIAKQKQNEERERKRIEDAKMQIKNLANDIMRKSGKPKEPLIINIHKESPKIQEDSNEVAYSFASAFQNSKGAQLSKNQSTHSNNQEAKFEHPEKNVYEEDHNIFMKKYVKDDEQIKMSKAMPSLETKFTSEEKPTSESTAQVQQAVLQKSPEQNQYEHFKFTYDKPSSVKMQEIRFKEPDNRIYSRQIKVDPVVGYQTNSTKDHDRAPNQKLKIYSSNKSKKSGSNKSSPAGPTSHQKSQNQQNAEVKTNPFTATAETTKVGIQIVQVKDKESKATPFESIKEVKEEKNSPSNYSSPSYGNKVSEYYATTKPVESFTASTNTYSKYETSATSAYPSYATTTGLPSYQNTGYVSNYHPSSYNTSKYEYTTYKTEEIKEERTFETTIVSNQPTYGCKKVAISDKKNYLAALDLKQSINVDEPNKVEFKEITTTKYQVSVKEEKSLLDRQIKQSLKESVNLQGSGEFDFNF